MPIRTRYYALGGILVAMVLNVLLRTLLRYGLVPVNLLVALAIGAGMAFFFARRVGRLPSVGERWRLLGFYAAGLALLYLALVALAAWRNPPSHAALLLYLVNYLVYPLAAWWFFRPPVQTRFLPR
ncbi:hypothetical protein VV867_23950 [Pseudomonas sp. JH-2]|uniref:hypothetical protein n=1 Tax=Pseudomonas sp. JH-2 TaxID=3114998 RepID=UPI002E26C798|nr:hypothetical protein [Pseudomonas sp. JH-2]